MELLIFSIGHSLMAAYQRQSLENKATLPQELQCKRITGIQQAYIADTRQGLFDCINIIL